VHQEEKVSSEQLCKRCLPEQKFTSFRDLLRHARSYHQKKAKEHEQLPAKRKKESGKSRLCENCGKTVSARMRFKHIPECPNSKVALKIEAIEDKANDVEDANEQQLEFIKRPKKYIPIHLSGICPYCDYKYSDLLGHVRLRHAKKDGLKTACSMCSENFNSVRELVTHRQLHPTFKSHDCKSCKAEFDTVPELRRHRDEACPRRRKKKRKATLAATSVAAPTANPANVEQKKATEIYEGRGTVGCALCDRTFTLKALLRRHYVSHHGYKTSERKPALRLRII